MLNLDRPAPYDIAAQRSSMLFGRRPARLRRNNAAIVNELRVRRDMRQLEAMDDHMLKDIGVHRCELEDGVRHGRSR
jgi:uncharacterized protein YjiS (DUF1127 family)